MNNTNNFNKIENTIMIEELNKELSTYSYTTSDNTCLEYFVGYEIAVILGYKNTTQVIQYISKSNQLQFRDYTGVKIPYLDPRTILISRDGAIEILLKTRKSISADVLQILQKFNIKTPTKKSITQKTQEIQEIQVNDTENNQELDFEEDDEENNELLTYSYISNHICFEYFVGYQIASLIGYKSPHSFITQNVSKSNQLIFRDYPGPKIPELDPRTILISRDGAIEILIKTRKRISADVLHLLKEFHIETTNMKCLTKEQQTLSAITNAFKTEKFEDQYKIGSYYLDLYFTEYKIVVECDENGHADRKPYKERERMDYVNKELDIDDSNWIRYNPDEKDFDISKMIGRIYIKINEIKFINQSKIDALNKPKLKKKEIVEKLVGLAVCQVCISCNESKILDEYYDREQSANGKETICKPCYLIRQQKARDKIKEELFVDNKKKCQKCKIGCDISLFGKNNRSKDGLNRTCNNCIVIIPVVLVKDRIEKCCSSCRITKNMEEFTNCRTSCDGKFAYCMPCAKIKNAIYKSKLKKQSKK